MNFIIIDTELGGKGGCSLLTVYLAYVCQDSVLFDLDLKLKPDDGKYIVTPAGMAINGIDLIEHDKVANTYKDSKTIIYNFLKNCYGHNRDKVTCCGHGVSGDIRQLLTHLISPETWYTFCSYTVIDTGILARVLQDCELLPSGLNLSVKEMADYFGLKYTPHVAKDDALITFQIYLKLRSLVKHEPRT